ncbi:SPFH domain-containing protein [Teredinibacter franksiae]|uniref:SPFH domain-containing protein n=1 Tax=Teredinibacter franksiae TaxID=2761453 RepID=UPI00162AF019|nr:SPFH domain-containing protein [Teredinibacter franksiae]
MNIELLLFLMFFLLIVVIVGKTVFMVQENQRLVVLRFGKLFKTIGPGICMVVPFTDLAVLVELNQYVPGWQKMTEEDLCIKVAGLVKENPDPKAFK